jgi:signal transduction histidine kinase
LSVRDNGSGFDASGGGEGIGYAGLGLTAMAERVRQVAGCMDIRSSPGRGTEIEVRFFLLPVMLDERGGPAPTGSDGRCRCSVS